MSLTRTLRSIALVAAAMFIINPLPAQAKKKSKKDHTEVHAPRYHYKFDHTQHPETIERYSLAVYTYSGDKTYTCAGHVLGEVDGPIFQMTMNPSGANYMVLANDKSGRKRLSYVMARDEGRTLHQFKKKEIGVPTATAYTPDARTILVATADSILYKVEQKKFKATQYMRLPFAPVAMEMSPNGYYIAMTDGNHLAVYALDERMQRMRMKYDSPVNAMRFNDNSSELGVLTADGLLSRYDTRNFVIKSTLDDLADANDFDYNFDGKYVAVAVSPTRIEVRNLVDSQEAPILIDIPDGGLTDLAFVPDASGQTILFYNTKGGIEAERMIKLSPYYSRMISEEANERLNQWLKMMPGETMEQYRSRVTDDSRRSQLRMYEDEAATALANNLVAMSTVTLGKYDRSNQVLEVGFGNMPAILLPVPQEDVTGFHSVSDLEFRNAKYGVNANDRFELIYAEVYNRADGKTYTYDNLDRAKLNYIDSDDNNIVSLEVVQRQQMEEMRLQELRQRVIEEAKQQSVISDHTHITVDSRVDPTYDATGRRILNYVVRFSYEVEPDFTAVEDFAPAQYNPAQSGAASSMLRIIKEAFEGDLAQYVVPGKSLKVNLKGSADALPVHRVIPYLGEFGDYEQEPVRIDDQLTTISVTEPQGITRNEQLAFIRAIGVMDFLNNNITGLSSMTVDPTYLIEVADEEGAQYRRITAEFTFVDALQ